AFHVGMAAFYAGAGRKKMSDPVDPAAGIRVLKKVGDSVTKGEPLAMVYSRTTDTELIKREMRAAYRIAESPAEPPPMVFGEVEV
ncbi:MAG TPA: pyrimidine-nucleoside phosphorylase, partial [Bacteroidetes bacterium]|nr:pyrimidine-nucleoside phosphorylase [Bacteroidota bacterium]